MQYKFLKQWAREQKCTELFFRSVKRWRDQYALILNSEKFLHINLLSQNPFCFYTDSGLIPWKKAPELAVMEKHLQRARLVNIDIVKAERIIFLEFIKPDPFSGNQKFRLYLELIPQFSNIILTTLENEKWKIIDCSKKITLSENPYRQIIPAAFYQLPPPGFKNENDTVHFPLNFDKNLQIIENAAQGDFNINTFLENFYLKGLLRKLSSQTRNNFVKSLQKEIRKKLRKLDKLKQELMEAKSSETWQQKGELLKSALSEIKPGMKSITLTNYYADDLKKIEIALQPDKPPAWNVDHYFKKYRKSLSGKEKITQQIDITKDEIAQLHKKTAEINEEELLLPGEFSLPQTAQTPLSEKLSRLKADESWEFVVGRNSKQNDYITMHLAKPDDWWFHTRIYKGTHILLRNLHKKKLPSQLLEIGARLAAYYSKARSSINVPVDYTQIRYVRKPRGSAPGYVIYTNQKTVYVNPLDLRSARNILKDIYAE